MGHLSDLAPVRLVMLNSSQESTVVCTKCHSTVKTLLTTPHGKLCPGCFKLVHFIESDSSKKIPA